MSVGLQAHPFWEKHPDFHSLIFNQGRAGLNNGIGLSKVDITLVTVVRAPEVGARSRAVCRIRTGPGNAEMTLSPVMSDFI